MKIGYCTDTHFSGKVRSFRTDNYARALLEKLDEFVERAREEKWDACLHGGDLFDQPKVSRPLLGEIIQVLRRLPCPLYLTPGNHDVFGYDVNTLPQTDLGILFRAGLVRRLDRSTGGTMLFGDRTMVWVEGQEYHKDIDRRDPALDYVIKDRKRLPKDLQEAGYRLYHVLMVHGMLMPHEYVATHTLIDDLPADHGADYMLVGHYHPGWDLQQVGGGYVWNIGSMGRTDAGYDNLDRHPPYAVLEFRADGTHSIEAFPFQSARPSHEVLDRSKRDQVKERATRLQEFAQKVEEANDFKAESALDILDQVITAAGLSDEDRAAAVKRIAEAEQVIDEQSTGLDGFVEAPGRRIAEVEVCNFQSWLHAKFSLTDGLNVIVGPSDNGKSALLRAIRWCLYNEPNGSTFITGADDEQRAGKECRVTITFTDGTRLTRRRTVDSAGSYIVERPGQAAQEFKGFSHHPPIDIFNTSQMPLVPVSKGTEISLNVAMQGDPLFMVQASPQERNALIGKLAGVQAVDAAIKLVDTEIKADARLAKTRQKDLKDVEARLKPFAHLDTEKRALDEAELLLRQHDLEEQEQQVMEALHDRLWDARREQQQTQGALAPLAGVLEAEGFLREAQAWAEELAALRSLHAGLLETREQLALARLALQQAGEPFAAGEAIQEAQALSAEIGDLVRLEAGMIATQHELHSTQMAMEGYKTLGTAERFLERAQELARETEDVQALGDTLGDLRARMQKGNSLITQANQEEHAAHEAYASTLDEAGVCPTCFGEIDKTKVLGALAHTH